MTARMMNEHRQGTTKLSRYRTQHTVLLTSFRRDGTPVGTPVSIVVDGDRALMRTYRSAWKVKRIRRNPVIEIAPSTFRGKVTGPAIRARTRFLGEAESEDAARMLARKYPFLHRFAVPLLHRLRHLETVYLELLPLGDHSLNDETTS